MVEILIVTGLSGAGKSRAMDALEDIGFYCVDNIPPTLIPKFAEICLQSQGKISRVAVVTDVRGGEMFNSLFDDLEELSKQGCKYKILFLDANDNVIIRRYKETRRRHPLQDILQGSMEQAVASERALLRQVRARADYMIDTSLLSPTQLRERINTIFQRDSGDSFVVRCISFGFKYGLPQEADLVFDVRCLPNPFYIDDLKHRTGLEAPVREYVLKWPQAQGLIPKLLDIFDYLLPLYRDEGKSELVIAIGCTGGKHRSVVFTELIYQHLIEKGYRVSVNHRDIQKP